jgi:hypothetical protein
VSPAADPPIASTAHGRGGSAAQPGEPRRPSRASLREALGAFIIYGVLAVVATYPLVRHAFDQVIGHVEQDPRLNAWAMSFVRHQLLSDPTRLFEGNAFFPYRHSLALSEHLLVPALLGAPVAAVTGNDVLAYNAVTLLTLALAGLGAFLLARELGVSRWAGLLAGIIYAFNTWNLNEVVRLQILSNQWFPFVVLALVRFFDRPGRRQAVAVGLFCILQSLSCMYWALYLPLLVGSLVVYLQWRRRLSLRELRPLLASLLLVLAITAVFALPYAELARQLDLRRERPQPLDLERYFDVLPGSLLEAWLGTARRNQNAAHFLGFSVMALGLWGIAKGRLRTSHVRLKPFLVGLGLVGFLLSLGPTVQYGGRELAPGPYSLLFDWAPGFRNVRFPERFSIFLILAAAPIAASGLDALSARLKGAAACFACLVVLLEHLALPNVLIPMPTGSAVPAVYRWLESQSNVRVVAEFPASRNRMERHDALPMWLSTFHWKRTLQGFTGYFPPTYNFSKWRLFHFPDPASVRFLERFGIDTVIVHPEAGAPPSWVRADPRWTVLGPFEGGHVALRLARTGALPFEPPAEEAGLAELPRAGWDVQASYAGAERAIDGDAATAWSTGERQGRGDFYRIRFPAPVLVSRVSLEVRDPYEFPTSLKLMAELDGETVELPFDAQAAYDRLFAALLHRPRQATLDLDLAPSRVTSLRLRVVETDPFWMPWTLSEVRVYGPAGPVRPPARVP